MLNSAKCPSPLTALAVTFAVAASTPAMAQDQRQAGRLTPPPQSRSTIDVPKIQYTEFTLPNGLRVLLHEDHSSPIVAVEVWYQAGIKYDPKGKTGIAHLFEHLMDEGSPSMPPGEYRRAIQTVGGYYNAMVTHDIARYWTVVPSNNLGTVLWLEAERMANVSGALDTTRLNRERDAIRNEYRQRVLANGPLSTAEAVLETLYEGSPYGIPSMGYPSELSTLTLDDLRGFYETYYVPNNAVLVIAGDVKAAEARRMVEKYFTPVPRGRPVVAPPLPTPLKGEKRIVVEHPSGVRGLWVIWRGASSASPDRAALMALSSIITQRLTRNLIEERKVSSIVGPGTNRHFDLQDGGVFQVAMTPSATAPYTLFEDVLDSVVASIKKDGVTATEVRRWVARYRMEMLTAMQSDSSKSSNLGDAAVVMKRPLGIYELVERAQLITPADVQAVARKYLTADRVVASLIPTGKLDMISKPHLPYVNATRSEKR